MTADIDAVLSRLRERPECRDAVEVIEELAGRTEFVRGLLRDARQGCEEARAERDRLREACFEASKRLYGSLARHRDLDLDLVSYRHLLEASTILNVALDAALGESPVPDEPTQTCCEWLPGTIGAETHCAHWHAADDPEFAGDHASAACCWCGDHEDGSGSCPGPSHPTGEERTDG